MAQLILWNSYAYTEHAPVRPLGPHQLASWLTQQGYSVKVIDFCNLMSVSELIAVTMNFVDKDTVAIGVSNTFWDNVQMSNTEPDWVTRARGFLENIHPGLDWSLGGSRNSYLVMHLKMQWVKFTGYGEDTVLKYLDEKTNSTIFRSMFNIQQNCGHFNNEMDIRPSEVLPIELSRGCQFKCRFCRYAEIGKKKNTYIRDYALIEEELMRNYEQYGVTRYLVMDDTANESIQKIEAMAKIAQRLPFRLEWVGYIRLDLIGAYPETAEMLIDAGLRGCYFGVESFHPAASLVIGKGWNGKYGKDFLLKLKDQWGDRAIFEIGLIAGLTGETEQDIDETHQWCIDNNIYSWRWTPLSVSKQPDQLWKSEFDLEYEKYGYTFPTDNDYGWVNVDWNYATAAKKAEELNEDRKSRVFLNPWHAAQVGSLGYEFEDLFKLKAHELDYPEMFARTKQRVAEYISYQKAI